MLRARLRPHLEDAPPYSADVWLVDGLVWFGFSGQWFGYNLKENGDAIFGGSETWRRRMLEIIKYFRVVHTIWPRLWKSIQRNIKISPNLRMPNGVLVEWIARSYLRLDCSFSLSYEITLCNLATSFELSGGRLLRWKSLGPQWKHPIGGGGCFFIFFFW